MLGFRQLLRFEDIDQNSNAATNSRSSPLGKKDRFRGDGHSRNDRASSDRDRRASNVAFAKSSASLKDASEKSAGS